MMRIAGKELPFRSGRDRLAVVGGTVRCPLGAGPINVERCLGCSSFRGRGGAGDEQWVICRGDHGRLLAQLPPG